MHFPVIAGGPTTQSVEALVVTLFSGSDKREAAVEAVDDSIGNTIAALVEAGEITGRSGELTVIHTLGDAHPAFAPQRVVVAGLGKREKLDLDTIRGVLATTARRLRTLGVKQAAALIPVGGLQR